MKKNLVFLTGIIFFFALLTAGGCQSTPKKDTNGDKKAGLIAGTKAPEEIDIYLRAVEIDGSMHLEMYDSKRDDCLVIDGLLTEAYPEDIVYWNKATASKIKEVTLISLMTKDSALFGNKIELEEIDSRGELWNLTVPDVEDSVTVKYEIHFIVVGNDKDTIVIDPYLRIKKQDQ